MVERWRMRKATRKTEEIEEEYSRGLVAVLEGREEEALAHFRAVLERDSRHFNTLLKIGEVLRRPGALCRGDRVPPQGAPHQGRRHPAALRPGRGSRGQGRHGPGPGGAGQDHRHQQALGRRLAQAALAAHEGRQLGEGPGGPRAGGAILGPAAIRETLGDRQVRRRDPLRDRLARLEAGQPREAMAVLRRLLKDDEQLHPGPRQAGRGAARAGAGPGSGGSPGARRSRPPALRSSSRCWKSTTSRASSRWPPSRRSNAASPGPARTPCPGSTSASSTSGWRCSTTRSRCCPRCRGGPPTHRPCTTCWAASTSGGTTTHEADGRVPQGHQGDGPGPAGVPLPGLAGDGRRVDRPLRGLRRVEQRRGEFPRRDPLRRARPGARADLRSWHLIPRRSPRLLRVPVVQSARDRGSAPQNRREVGQSGSARADPPRRSSLPACFVCAAELVRWQHLGACPAAGPPSRPLRPPLCRGCGLPGPTGSDLLGPARRSLRALPGLPAGAGRRPTGGRLRRDRAPIPAQVQAGPATGTAGSARSATGAATFGPAGWTTAARSSRRSPPIRGPTCGAVSVRPATWRAGLARATGLRFAPRLLLRRPLPVRAAKRLPARRPF